MASADVSQAAPTKCFALLKVLHWRLWAAGMIAAGLRSGSLWLCRRWRTGLAASLALRTVVGSLGFWCGCFQSWWWPLWKRGYSLVTFRACLRRCFERQGVRLASWCWNSQARFSLSWTCLGAGLDFLGLWIALQTSFDIGGAGFLKQSRVQRSWTRACDFRNFGGYLESLIWWAVVRRCLGTILVDAVLQSRNDVKLTFSCACVRSTQSETRLLLCWTCESGRSGRCSCWSEGPSCLAVCHPHQTRLLAEVGD